MKAYKFFIILIALSFIFTGCKKPIRGTDDAAIGYQDVPLYEYSLEDFVEPPAELDYVFRTVYFDYNKYNIKTSEAPILNGIAEWMRNNTSKHLLIEGHCDERGSNEYNYSLGEQRALSVRRYLINLGVDAQRLHTVSYGEERPVAFGHDESSWNKNRRAEFLISK